MAETWCKPVCDSGIHTLNHCNIRTFLLQSHGVHPFHLTSTISDYLSGPYHYLTRTAITTFLKYGFSNFNIHLSSLSFLMSTSCSAHSFPIQNLLEDPNALKKHTHLNNLFWCPHITQFTFQHFCPPYRSLYFISD